MESTFGSTAGQLSRCRRWLGITPAGPEPTQLQPPKARKTGGRRLGLNAISEIQARRTRVDRPALRRLLTFAGLLGMLHVGSTGKTKDLATLLVAPATAVVWLAIGLVGIAMSVRADRARLFLIGAGALLTAWGLAGLLTQGATDVLTNDPSTVALLLVLGVGALAVSLGPTPDFVEKALALPDADAEAEKEGGPASDA